MGKYLPGTRASGYRSRSGRAAPIFSLRETARQIPLEFRLENMPGDVSLMGNPDFSAPRDGVAQTSLLILLDSKDVKGSSTKLKVGVYSNGKRLETVNTVFDGPRNQ